MKEKWWKHAVGYQIYPRSFQDSNGDGIGDLRGIIQRLPYLNELGVDFLWITPIYASPNFDNGYDISDYYAINPEYGTLEDFKELLEKAHQLKIKIILDLVVNHTSDQHPWFKESRKSKDNPYRDYYLWADATPDQMPNDWQSFFGGPTWTYDPQTEQAYFHVFAKEQPDLNWKNPKMRQEIYDMVEWWLKLGIDGFRLDAIAHLQKEPWDFKITDNPWAPFMNVEGISEYLEGFKALFEKYDVMTVGEASGVSSKQAPNWTDPDKWHYMDMIFELEHNYRKGEPGHEKVDPDKFRDILARWQKDQEFSGWNALYIDNHDLPRMISDMADGSSAAAKAIGMAYFFLKGTPFIYQGQEIGMTNYPFKTLEEVDAKDTKNHYQEYLKEGLDEKDAFQRAINITRDHGRTPMQWDNSEKGGFTTGTPWLAVNKNTKFINVEDERPNDSSVLSFYKKLIIARQSHLTFEEGSFDLVHPEISHLFAYTREIPEEKILIASNLSSEPIEVDFTEELEEGAEVILSSITSPKGKIVTLPPYGAVMWSMKRTIG